MLFSAMYIDHVISGHDFSARGSTIRIQWAKMTTFKIAARNYHASRKR